jgi:hypothetical protein
MELAMIFDIAVLLAPTWLAGLYLLARRMRRARRAADISTEVAERTKVEPPVFTSQREPAAPASAPQMEAFRAEAAASLGAMRREAPMPAPLRAEPPVTTPKAAPSAPAVAAPRAASQDEVFHIDFDDDK